MAREFFSDIGLFYFVKTRKITLEGDSFIDTILGLISMIMTVLEVIIFIITLIILK